MTAPEATLEALLGRLGLSMADSVRSAVLRGDEAISLKPVHTRSLGRARRYAAFLGPMHKALEETSLAVAASDAIDTAERE